MITPFTKSGRQLLCSLKKHALHLLLLLALLPATVIASAANPVSATFKALPPASIASFAPASGAPGTLIKIKGGGFTGATQVTVGNKAAIIISVADTTVVAMVMSDNVTGSVKVTTAGGTVLASATNFTVTATPFPTQQLGSKMADTTTYPNAGYINGYRQPDGSIPPSAFRYKNIKQGNTVTVSADGNTAVAATVAGLNYESEGFFPKGGLTFYEKRNGGWMQTGQYVLSSGLPITWSNSVVLSADGTKMLVASTEYWAGVYLFEKQNGVWKKTDEPFSGQTAAISADGNTVVTGSSKVTYGRHTTAYEYTSVYHKVNGAWVKDAPAGPFSPNFPPAGTPDGTVDFGEGKMAGASVALSADGKTMAATAVLGGTYLLQYNGTQWLVQNFFAGTLGAVSLSADGNVLLQQGVLYTRTGSNWAKVQTLPEAGQGSLTADGSVLLLGSNAGPVVYTRNNAGTWIKQSTSLSASPAVSVVISADGTNAFTGFPEDAGIGQVNTKVYTQNSVFNPVNNVPVSVIDTSYRLDPYGSITAFSVKPPLAVSPTSVSTNIIFFPQTPDSVQFTFVNGNGAARAVFIKQGSTDFPTVADGVSYTANPRFGQGTPAGAGWYCIYNGPHTRTDAIPTMAGLTPGTPYIIAIIEYNGKFGTEKYATEGATGKITTDDWNIRAKNPAFSNVTGTSATLSWTNGSGVGRMVFVSTTPFDSGAGPSDVYYSPNTKYGSGNQVNGYYCVYNGTGNSVNITGLTSGQRYRAIVYDYNGSLQSPRIIRVQEVSESAVNIVTPISAPTGYATALKFTNTAQTTTTMSWTNGTGTSRAVFIKIGTLGYPAPVDGSSYTANANFPGGTQIGTSGWYCVYNGNGSSVNITGLTANTNYHTAVVEYNGTTGVQKYLTSKGGPADVKTLVLPTGPATPPTGYATSLAFSNTASTSTTLSWVSSNGSARAVFLKLGTSGALNVVQGQTYTANSTFKQGAQAGTNGWYCVYNGTGSSVNIAGLTASSTYRAIVLEYNGTAGTEGYNLSRYNGANVTTTVAPALLLTSNQKRMLVEQDDLTDKGSSELNVHQGMSPNADGVNDVFTIDGIGAYPQNTVQIMNSNGDLIFSAAGYDNYSKAFDGRANNGTLQKAGTYFYSLEYKKGSEVLRKTGYLVIKY